MRIRFYFIVSFAAAVTLFASCSKEGESELTPPTGHSKAEPGIIGVDSKGNLTLDGWKADNPAYVVHFKWGSLIAVKGNKNSDVKWKNGITDIAWVPEEYKPKLGSISDYASIPYATDIFPEDSPVDGLGDPCHFAKKDGVAGGYRMPTGNPYEQFTPAGYEPIGGNNAQPVLKSVQGQFYLFPGFRSAIGTTYGVGNTNSSDPTCGTDSYGGYWTSTPAWDGNSYSLYLLYNVSTSTSYISNCTLGFAVRCVLK